MESLLKDIIEALLILNTDADKDEAECQLVHAQGQLQLLGPSGHLRTEISDGGVRVRKEPDRFH